MILSTLILFGSTLISGIVASPVEIVDLAKRAQNVLIGYRTVHPLEAASYKKAGNILTFSPGRGGKQLGAGIYTTPNAKGWAGNAGDVFCAIFAELESLNSASKAWVPQDVWWNEAKVEGYLKNLGGLDPAKTMRMSVIDGLPDTLQMLIPPALIGKNGGMGFSTICNENVEALGEAEVEYEKWTKVSGEAQKAEARAVEGEVAAGEEAAAETVVEGEFGDADLQARLVQQGEVAEGKLAAEGAEAAEVAGAAESAEAIEAAEVAEVAEAASAATALEAAEAAEIAAAGEAAGGAELLGLLAFV